MFEAELHGPDVDALVGSVGRIAVVQVGEVAQEQPEIGQRRLSRLLSPALSCVVSCACVRAVSYGHGRN